MTERENTCVAPSAFREGTFNHAGLAVRERESERVCVRESVCVFVRERECMRERERETSG